MAMTKYLPKSVTLQEFSGSLGDLGTFLPLVVALSATIQLDLGTTLFFTGVYNVISGLIFKIPMCVQPMHAIAAVALAAPGLTLPEVMSAGFFVSGTMMLLGVTGAMTLFNAIIPGSIVRGIQLAVGLLLAKKGACQALMLTHSTWRPWLGVEGLLLGLFGIIFLVATTTPSASADKQQQQNVQQQQQQQQDMQQAQQQWQQKPAMQHANCDSDTQQLPDIEQQAGDSTQPVQLQQRQDSAYDQLPCKAVGGSSTQYRLELVERLASPPGTSSSISSINDAQEAAAAMPAAEGCCGSSSIDTGGMPSALLIVLLGLILTPIAHPHVLHGLSFGPNLPSVSMPTWEQLKSGVMKAGVAQLPLTSLNSVIAVTQLAQQLFPAKAAVDGWRWQPGAVAMSVGMMNIIGCWFGALPCCHGAGGLAAQYKFGARTGTAPVLLGVLKIALALLFGSSVLQLLQHFPQPLLGAMMLMAGLELAASARKETSARGCSFMLLTTATILGLGNTATGFVVGLGGYVLVLAYEWCCSRVARLALSTEGKKDDTKYALVPREVVSQ